MLIAGFPAGPWGTNCYVAATGPGAECVVIDPGKDAADGIAQIVREHRLKPVAVLVTHGHVDHMFSVAPVAGTYDATAWVHPKDRHLLSDPMRGMSAETTRMMLGGDYTWAEPDDVRELADGQALELAGLRFVVDHTPGHTQGSVTFRAPSGAQPKVTVTTPTPGGVVPVGGRIPYLVDVEGDGDATCADVTVQLVVDAVDHTDVVDAKPGCDGTLLAARRAVDLILETAGGTLAGPVIKIGSHEAWSREIKLTPDYVRAKVGFDITDDEMRDAFHGLQLPITSEHDAKGGVEWTISIPSHRGDLDRPIDLVEEVLRIYGTDRIPAQVSTGPALVDGDDDPIAVYNRRVTEHLVGQNFHEVVNYTLRSRKELATWASDAAAAELGLANPFVDDQSHLRPTLILGIMESLKLNQSRGVAASRLFETGRVFLEVNGTVQECVSVGFVLAHNPKDRAWLTRPEPDFYAVKREMEVLAQFAGIDLAAQGLMPVRGSFWGWQEGQSAAAGEIHEGWTARFGLLNLAMVRAFGLEGKVWAGTLALLPAKLAGVSSRKRYQPFSLFPAALRDLALVVDDGRHAEDVRRELLKAARAATNGAAFAVESVQVFDVYQGKGLPEGKKSLACSLSFRSA